MTIEPSNHNHPLTSITPFANHSRINISIDFPCLPEREAWELEGVWVLVKHASTFAKQRPRGHPTNCTQMWPVQHLIGVTLGHLL